MLKKTIACINRQRLVIGLLVFATLFFTVNYLRVNLGLMAAVSITDYLYVFIGGVLVTLGSVVLASAIYLTSKKVLGVGLQKIVLLVFILLISHSAGNLYDALPVGWGLSRGNLRLFLSFYLLLVILSVIVALLCAKLKKDKEQSLLKALVFGLGLVTVFSIFQTANIERPARLETAASGSSSFKEDGSYAWYDLDELGLDIDKANENLGENDVYIVLLDGYPAFDVLEKVYDYNSPLKQYFNDNGFFINDSSRPNYHETFMSVSSSLRLQYTHEELFSTLGISDNESLPRSWLRQNETIQFYQNSGYKFASISSWGELDLSAIDDFEIDVETRTNISVGPVDLELSEFTSNYLQNSVLRLSNTVASGDASTGYGAASLEALNKAQAIPEDPSSTFSLVYSWLPHTPLYFDYDGNLVDDPYAIEPDGRVHWGHPLYVENVKAIDAALIEFFDQVFSKSAESEQEPVFLIMSDHGTANLFDKYKYKTDNSVTLDDALIERFKNLQVLYFADQNYDGLEGITNLNAVRSLLNYSANQSLDLLEDNSYYSERYYDFDEITDLVDR